MERKEIFVVVPFLFTRVLIRCYVQFCGVNLVNLARGII